MTSSNVSFNNIKKLFEKGDYIKAHNLVGEHKITEDCRNICHGIKQIVENIDESITDISSLEESLSYFDSELGRVRVPASKIEEEDHEVQLKNKNIKQTCALVEDMIKNLTISSDVQRVLLEGFDEVEQIERALNELERVLVYKPEVNLKCVHDQKEKAKQIVQVYREALVRFKRDFDGFMERQLNTIREFKAPKQPKCGVLSVVRNFEQFVKQVETFVQSTGTRRADVDKWYVDSVMELFKVIDQTEHSKTPVEMIRLENYNYLHDILRSLKLPCLESQCKEAKAQYKAALEAYVSRYFGRPLEKLNIFFEGVQMRVNQGVKEEDISFQLAFSKQELRKVLQMVTLREVRKGLEEMYKRIERHVYEPDSNLTQVIWRAMQEEFIKQYKAIQRSIERCYPSANLNLTFTIDDLLRVFEDIAQSH